MIFLPLFTALFTLPTGAITSTTAYIGGLFDSVGELVWLAIGVPLGFYIIKKVIGVLPKR